MAAVASPASSSSEKVTAAQQPKSGASSSAKTQALKRTVEQAQENFDKALDRFAQLLAAARSASTSASVVTSNQRPATFSADTSAPSDAPPPDTVVVATTSASSTADPISPAVTAPVPPAAPALAVAAAAPAGTSAAQSSGAAVVASDGNTADGGGGMEAMVRLQTRYSTIGAITEAEHVAGEGFVAPALRDKTADAVALPKKWTDDMAAIALLASKPTTTPTAFNTALSAVRHRLDVWKLSPEQRAAVATQLVAAHPQRADLDDVYTRWEAAMAKSVLGR